jgi:hypothetical protein
LEPHQEKKLFCEIFSKVSYFMHKFVVKVNFIKIITCSFAKSFLKTEAATRYHTSTFYH